MPDDFHAVENSFYVTSDLPLIWCYFQLKFANLPSLVSASAVPAINRETALSQQVPFSPDKEIQAFCTSLKRIIQAADDLNKEADELTETRDALIPLLLSGKITPINAVELLTAA
jgi:type I restriction enzyme S subunit